MADDFNTIRFFISGIPLDGRKGQLLFLAALQQFEREYRAKKPDKYRPYSLDLVAIGNDYISEQIIAVGKAVLGKSLHIHPVVEKESALAIANKCNVTVCSSLNETFALYVAEGMLMGHPIIRNRTSGWQEQIKDGQNGYLFNTLSLDDLTKAISKILSKDLTNQQLQKMGQTSQNIASAFGAANYYQQINRQDSDLNN
jgi:glycosyltransferase involved in cell wall biosynthesis